MTLSIDSKISLMNIISSVIYIFIGIIIYKIFQKILNKSIKTTNSKLKINEQRTHTIKILILNIIKYIIVALVVLAILANFGINVKSILAGLGITTAIIGLAFQDLAKDIIAGISIITENQYEVGDTIEVDGFKGEVVFLGLKTTKIRDYKGATKIIANHHMDKIINYSLNDSLAIVDVGVGYEHSPEEVEKVLQELVQNLNGKIEQATGNIDILGINSLDASAVTYRITVTTKPMEQYAVERLLRKEIKKAFDKANIKIPYPQIEVHNGK